MGGGGQLRGLHIDHIDFGYIIGAGPESIQYCLSLDGAVEEAKQQQKVCRMILVRYYLHLHPLHGFLKDHLLWSQAPSQTLPGVKTHAPLKPRYRAAPLQVIVNHPRKPHCSLETAILLALSGVMTEFTRDHPAFAKPGDCLF